jgi:hypothetical protein
VGIEGLPVAFSNAGCVCVETHNNSNGDLGRYAAPAVPAMKTLLGRNRCPLAGFTIGKQHWKLAAFRLECDWLSRNGERNKCLTGRRKKTQLIVI